jgi:drug/metabolite transporter (DMT)-like permease
LSAGGYGTANYLASRAARRQHPPLTVLQSQSVALAVVAVAAVCGPGRLGDDAVRGLCGGVLGFGGAAATYLCFARGRPVGIAAAVLATTSAAVPVGAGLAVSGPPAAHVLAGAAVAVVAVAVLCWPDRTTTDPQSAALAATGGIFFGLYHVVMSGTRPGGGQWPLVASQSAIVLLATAAALAVGTGPATRVGSFLSVGDGLASSIATVAALLAVRTAALSQTGALIGLAPVITAVLARLGGERLPARQATGVGLSALAVACLSAD